MDEQTRGKLLLALLAASLAAAAAGALLLAEARASNAEAEPLHGKAILEVAPAAKLRSSMLFGEDAVVKPAAGSPARAPTALLEDLWAETTLRLPKGARAASHTVRVTVDVAGYPLILLETRGQGPPPERIDLNPAEAREAAAKAAEEAGLPPPRRLHIAVTATVTVETPLDQETLTATAAANIETANLELEASRAEASLLIAAPQPPKPPIPAKTALLLLAAGAAASLAAAAGYATTRRRPLLPPDATIEGTIEPNGRPLALLRNPEKLADIAAETGEPIILDRSSGRACVATRSAIYCAELQHPREEVGPPETPPRREEGHQEGVHGAAAGI